MSIHIDVAKHILYEDEFILVIDKPCSLMVEPDRNGHPNLLQQVRKYFKNKSPKGTEIYAQHIHRLDRPVSGIVLFAKQKSVLKNLSEQFAERKVKKYYRALTTNAPEQVKGTLNGYHRKEKKRAVISNEEFTGSEKISLDYEIEKLPDGKVLWKIELHTGKFHQIRAQLSAIGCPVIGDHFYGSEIPYHPDSIALDASTLVFSHPITNEEMIFSKEKSF